MATMEEAIEHIAKSTLGILTLEERGRDSLDFYDLSVMAIKQALQEAYCQGYADGKKR